MLLPSTLIVLHALCHDCRFLPGIRASEYLADLGLAEDELDDRTVADALVEQVRVRGVLASINLMPCGAFLEVVSGWCQSCGWGAILKSRHIDERGGTCESTQVQQMRCCTVASGISRHAGVQKRLACSH